MLDGHSLFVGATSRDFFVTSHELIDLILITDARYYESCWCRVEDIVVDLTCLLVGLVVLLERPDQARLCANPTIILEMVDEYRLSWQCLEPFV